MKITFATELLQFVESLDIVNQDISKKIKGIIDNYVKEEFGIDKVKIMRIVLDNEKNVLVKFNLKNSDLVQDYEFATDGQMPFIVNQNHPKPAWITCLDENKFLDECKEYIDHWSNFKNIPNYVGKNGEKYKTSIIIPYFEERKNKEFVQGVVNYESEKFLIFSKEKKEAILELTKVISKLLFLRDVYIKQTNNTIQAIKKIEKKLEIYQKMDKVENKIFLAYPENSNKNVINLIKEVLKSDFEDIEYIDWAENQKPGKITNEIFKAIKTSKYGICYLSEKDANGKYKDNLNVMFEAGLMQSKSSNLWIPIREKDSPEKAFDISGLNHIEIVREDGMFNIETFKDNLRKMLQAMIVKE